MVSYPTDFIDAAKLVIEIVRASAIEARKAEFAHALWNITGVASSWVFGNPDAIVKAVEIDEQLLVALKAALEDVKADDALPKVGINPFLIIAFIKLILDLLNISGK